MCCCTPNMNVSPYLTILLIIGSQRTAQVWDGRHSSHHIPSQFSTISMHATSGRVFVHLRKCLTWPGFGVAVEAYTDWAPWPPGDNLDNSCCFKEIPPKQKAQQNHKINSNFHGKMKLEETLCLSSKSQPIHFETYRLSISEVSGAKRRGHASSGT